MKYSLLCLMVLAGSQTHTAASEEESTCYNAPYFIVGSIVGSVLTGAAFFSFQAILGPCLLLKAADDNNCTLASILLNHANVHPDSLPNFSDSDNDNNDHFVTPALHHAAYACSLNPSADPILLRLLLERGAHYKKNPRGFEPIHYALAFVHRASDGQAMYNPHVVALLTRPSVVSKNSELQQKLHTKALADIERLAQKKLITAPKLPLNTNLALPKLTYQGIL